MRNKEQRMNRKNFRLFKGLIPVSMAFALMWSTGVTVLAEDGTNTPTGGETTTQTGTDTGGAGESAGAGDVTEDTSVALEANTGSAVIAEVITQSGGHPE